MHYRRIWEHRLSRLDPGYPDKVRGEKSFLLKDIAFMNFDGSADMNHLSISTGLRNP